MDSKLIHDAMTFHSCDIDAGPLMSWVYTIDSMSGGVI